MSLKPSEVLSEAADLIEPEGAWCQGELRRGCAFCLIGAIEVSAGAKLGGLPPLAVIHAKRFARKAIGRPLLDVWNDAPGRKQSEVVEALRKASALALSEGQ